MSLEFPGGVNLRRDSVSATKSQSAPKISHTQPFYQNTEMNKTKSASSANTNAL